MEYVSRTDAELEVLAQDIVAGKVFHTLYQSEHILKAGMELTSIFMPLLLMESDMLKEMQEKNIYSFYEYIDKAGPRSCNGLPSFFSVCLMDETDTQRLHVRVHDIATARQKLLDEAKGG